MGGFFSLDNPFFSIVSKIVDMILLSLLYVVVCIPIITIGPATTALYYTSIKVIRRERGYLTREFFHSFKENFKVGALATIVLIILYGILHVDRSFAANLAKKDSTKGLMLLCFFNVFTVVLFCVTIYVFPVLSRFTLGVRQIFKDSFCMSIRHLPSTILMALIVLVSGFCIYYFYIPFLIMPALCCFLMSFIMERIFKKYMPESEGEPEETGKDEWYLE